MSKTIIILFTYLLCLGCNINEDKLKERELDLREREIALKEKELSRDSVSINTSILKDNSSLKKASTVFNERYVYVVLKVKEPVLVHISGHSSAISDVNIPDFNSVNYDHYYYASKIVHIKNWNETAKYKHIDLIRSQFAFKLQQINMNFHSDILVKVRDENEKERLSRNEAKIVNTQIKSFGSYKEASITRSKYRD